MRSSPKISSACCNLIAQAIRPRILHAEFPPVSVPQEFHDRIQGVGMGQAFISHLPPNSLQSDVAQCDSCLIEDHLAQLQKILVTPKVAVAPPRFCLELPFNLPDQTSIHRSVLMVMFCTILTIPVTVSGHQELNFFCIRARTAKINGC
jgi:hypothetical protein